MVRIVIVFVLGMVIPGCATIVKSSKPKMIPFVCSLPFPQEIRIVNKSGTVEQSHLVGSDTTWITLQARESFLKRKKYTVLYVRSGFPTDSILLKPKLTGWFWGNIPLGVVWIFVDGGTGAMYQLPKVVNH